MSDEQPAQLPEVLPPAEADVVVSGADRGRAIQENKWLERELAGHRAHAAKLRNDLVNAHIQNLDADRRMRETYASRILKYLEWYSAGVGLLVVGNGFGGFLRFHLADDVVTTLVGSTAVAAIGLVGFIARGLFRSPAPPPPTEGES